MASTSSAKVDFILPDLGEGVHEAEIISWKVNVGDTVEEMQVLAEMETDKALVEVPSPYAGKVVALHGKVGQIAHVGNPIVTFENATQNGRPVAGGSASAASASGGGGGGHAANNGAPARAVESGVETKGAAAATHSNASVAGGPPSAAGTGEDAGTVVGSLENVPTLGGGGKAMATPAVRRLAKELGVDINAVRGTGRGGRVTASDVEAAAKSGGGMGGRLGAVVGAKPQAAPTVALAPAEHGARESVSAAAATFAPVAVDAAGTAQTIPFRGVRRKIAESLDRSVKTAVHFTVMDKADVTALERVRRQQAAASGEKLSLLPFIIQAACRALKQFPQLNAIVDDAKSEILIKGVINVGVAVDTDYGLMVPVIPNADRMAVLPLGRAITELANQCKTRTIPLDRMRGGTFTVSNVGSYGGAFATPIINYPEVAILAAGRAREAVMARNGAIHIGKELPLSLSCDHRVVDGAYGARLLNQIVQHLENPEVLLEPAGR